MVLYQSLNSPFDKSLLVAVAMVLFAAVLELLFAFLLPVELKVDISGCDGQRVAGLDQVHDGFENLLVSDALNLGVKAYIFGHNFKSHFNEGFNVLAGKSIDFSFPCFHKFKSDFSRLHRLSFGSIIYFVSKHF